jgi:NitT/TauT family transport system substrate-binding protein
MRFPVRAIFGPALLPLCVSIVVGCASPAAAPGVAQQAVEIKLGVVGQGSDAAAPEFAAQDRGIYAKYGLNVEITEYNSGPAAQEALAGGSADIIHYFPPGVATAVKQGVKQRMIATDIVRPFGWYVMSAATSGIRTPQDLNGKKIGITAKGATTDFYALWIADKYKVQLEIVPVGFPALYPGVLAGTIDAAVIPPPLSFKGVQTGELQTVVDLGKEMPPNMPDVVTVSDDLISKQPQAVSSYLKAIFETIRFMKQDQGYSVDFLMKHTKQERAIAEKSYELIIKQLSDDGSFTTDWLENSLSLARLGGITDLPPTDQLHTTRFVPAR